MPKDAKNALRSAAVATAVATAQELVNFPQATCFPRGVALARKDLSRIC